MPRPPRSRIRRAQPRLTRTTTFTDDGLTLIVKESVAVSGRPFVLVPGIGVASRYFGPLATALLTRGPVFVLELPGMGDAPEPRDPLPMERYGSLVARWMDASGITDAVLVGHSMGTQVVVEAALQHPAAVGHAVLIGTVTDVAEQTLPRQMLRLAQDTLRERPDVNWIVATDYLKCGPRWMLKQAPVMVAYPMLERAAELRMPVLAMRGEHDPICSEAWNRSLAEAIPVAAHHTLTGRAHVGMYVDAATPAALIVQFAGIARGVDDTREAGSDGGAVLESQAEA
ncbi:alpha/beta fold hydrolase [Leifsonia flava]|uniref:Alpha/beta hydrolase n=1 Tax=Orlajensenia leifsoniae TaxID=2561933 RepID=A0A4Y9R353_9MICO|nr:alpha/beta hydrolase [Leifsonia flava]TFV98707.1 alpha/beta hydrolase [Leifsonia flava]